MKLSFTASLLCNLVCFCFASSKGGSDCTVGIFAGVPVGRGMNEVTGNRSGSFFQCVRPSARFGLGGRGI